MTNSDNGFESRLAAALAGVARDFQRADSPEGTLQAITHAAVETVEGAEQAGVTLVVRRREVITMAATDPLVDDLDAVQYSTGQGPCLSALWDSSDGVASMSDMREERRWPDWTAQVQERGIRSMLCFRLFVAEDRLGALNLYAYRPEVFDEEDAEVGRLLAAHAAVALAAAQRIRQLNRAVDSRDLIGQAKGILMQRYGFTADAAFDALVRTSQSTHIKLHEVARRIVEDFRPPPSSR